MTTVHLQTGSSTVQCGATMGHWRDNPTGWDLGTVTVDMSRVTCPDCLPAVVTERAVQSSGTERDADDVNYDAFLNWCEEHGHNPDAGTSIVEYADHLDAIEREGLRR